jgi:AcrR family transcriptional regulator
MARTRSASAHQKVLEAAIELIADRGVDTTSMDAIAAASGVSKATIYKHWADKDTLLLEVLSEINCLDRRPKFDTGRTRADMLAVLSYRPQERRETRERIMPHFIAYSARNLEFGLAWRNRVMEPPRRELRHLLKLGIAKGEISPKPDIELSLALLLGPMIYWHVFLKKSDEKKSEDDPKHLGEGVIDAFWRAFAINNTPPKAILPQSQKSQRTHAL